MPSFELFRRRTRPASLLLLREVLAEEGEGAPPGVVRGGLVIDVGPLVVEERVVHVRVDVDV